MDLLILKTDIQTKKNIRKVKPILNKHPYISTWSIDTEDIDNVLRIEASNNLSENDIINQLKSSGFFCEILMD